MSRCRWAASVRKRSVPADSPWRCGASPRFSEIAERAAHRAPKAWIVNFTNPASIVTQGLHDAGFTNAVGICDSSDTMARDAAAYLGLVSRDIRLRVFGLNHCSFAGEIIAGGEDVLPKLLADDAFLDRFLGLYEKPLLRELGALPNEYLYYYFSCDKAVGALLAEKKTRGELVKEMHDEFFRGARENGSVRPVAALFELHESLLARRHKTYMDYAWKESKEGQRPKEKTETDPEGYAGVALDLIQGLSSASPRRVVLNYRNGGALDAFAHHDIAELSYDVSTDGIKPVAPPRVPERARELFARVKLF
ncbi:MAG: hypothetical protein M5R36_29320 [Deltaproteobacteria bacterium]|nr:hypothetical protein [Deltaproteobacteria bacterium]